MQLVNFEHNRVAMCLATCNLGCTPLAILSFPGGQCPLVIKTLNNLKMSILALCISKQSRELRDGQNIIEPTHRYYLPNISMLPRSGFGGYLR